MWPFSKKNNKTKSTEDWKIGDLAECISGDCGWQDFKTDRMTIGPATGDLLRVADISLGNYRGNKENLYLSFSIFKNESYESIHFRKVPPIEECEQLNEFIKNSNKVKV